MAGEVVKFEQFPAQRRSFDEIMLMASAFCKSGMFGVKTQDQALALMLMAEAEGKHVATAMQDYDVIQGRPALKADAMLGRFQVAGGHVKWIEMTDDKCSGEFSHPSCAPHVIDWDMDRAKQAGLGAKDNWRKFRRQMLRARTIAEGVRSTFPACLRGAPHYVSEEVQDFEPVASPAVTIEPDAGPSQANAAAQHAAGAEDKPPASAPVQTMSKKDAREDFGIMVEEMRRITSSRDLKAWGKMNAERVKLQPKDWQGEIRTEYKDLMQDLEHQEHASAEADEEFADAR